jgi:hypothetical protein
MADEKRPDSFDSDAPAYRGRTPIPILKRGSTPIPKHQLVETRPDEQAGLTPIPKNIRPSDSKKSG